MTLILNLKKKKLKYNVNQKKNQIIERFELAKVSTMAENNSYGTEREREREREISVLRFFFYYSSLTHTLQGTLFIYN